MSRHYVTFDRELNIFIEDAEADYSYDHRTGEIILEGVIVAGNKYLGREWLIEMFGKSAVYDAEMGILEDGIDISPFDDGSGDLRGDEARGC